MLYSITILSATFPPFLLLPVTNQLVQNALRPGSFFRQHAQEKQLGTSVPHSGGSRRSHCPQRLPKVSLDISPIPKKICFDSRYIFTKIGVLLGLKQIQVKKPPHNPVLEKAYSTSKRWKLARVLVILILPNLVFRCRCGAWPSNSTCRWRKCRDGSS
jgi:hypothetical protein